MRVEAAEESLKAVQAIKADTHAVSTVTGSAIDTRGFDEILYVVNAGTFTATGDATITITECDTSGGTYAAITGAAFSEIAAASDDTVYVGRVKCSNTERYHKVVCVVADDTVDLGVVGILVKHDKGPVTQVNDAEFTV